MSLVRAGLAALLISASALSSPASAETIFGALSRAYANNPTLNQARANVRVFDEEVPIAKSTLRPQVSALGSIDYTAQEGTRLTTGSFGVAVNQLLFDGFQTRNNVRSAQSRIRAETENLRNTEQNILFNGAAAYMDVIRYRRIAELTAQNLAFLNEQVRAARSRFEVGEGTRTDVAQAEASQARARADVSTARSLVASSEATYRQIIGAEPRGLELASPLSRLLPRSLDSARAQGAEQHPAILASEFLVDQAAYLVKVAEGAALPQVSASANLTQQFERTIGVRAASLFNPSEVKFEEETTPGTASVGARIDIPIYQGGRISAQVRQSKEQLGQARIAVDVSRDQVRAAIESAWAEYTSNVDSVGANRQVVAAAQLALNGVIEERNVGQRTTLDVLNAQATVIDAQITLVGIERDLVVSTYAILSATGALSAERLGLKVAVYNPDEHYNAVKDKWGGLRTPDGR